jgi:histidinol-phosphate/aromatic aminotransferase/cobyric acid decarboxylase-like protein/choline kinase
MAKRAIILAAGQGTRLRPLTNDVPKGLVRVNGVSILDNALEKLSAVGVEEVVLVVGYRREKIVEEFGSRNRGMEIRYVIAEDYDTTNNLVSLWKAREYLDRDVFLLESDVFFDENLLPRMLGRGNANVVALDRCRAHANGTTVLLDGQERVSAVLSDRRQRKAKARRAQYKTINIYRFRGDFLADLFLPYLRAYIDTKTYDQFYEVVLSILSHFHRLKCRLEGEVMRDVRWVEIDDSQDLKRAEYLFASPQQRFRLASALHGGYWAYDFQDHAYLYNPYFPPAEFQQELATRLPELLTHYPSCHETLAECLAPWVGVQPRRLVLGNGAAELIRGLASLHPSLTVSTPSFNEYERCAARLQRVPLPADTWEFDTDRFQRVLCDAPGSLAVIVSPNNPTSRLVPRRLLLDLIGGMPEQRFVVDESFLDFSEGESLVDQIEACPNLIVLKSLGKALGMCGVRLGYLACSDERLVQQLRAQAPIWNINGAAEFVVRNMARYDRQFTAACRLVRRDALALHQDLAELATLRVWRPDANFVLCAPTDPAVDAEVIAERLFCEHDILVKRCHGKSMADGQRYLRIGSRTTSENARLVQAMRAVLGIASQPRFPLQIAG